MNNLIGVSGKIGSGKDLLCDIINYLTQEEDWGSFERFMEESNAYYDTYKNLFSDKKEAEKMCDEIWDHTDFLETLLLTPRKLLQLIGTEAGRQIIHPNIWVNALFADYVCNDCGQKECPTDEEDTGQMIHRSFPNWIITDVRFPNEVEAIEDKGGTVIRIERTPRSYGTEFEIEHSSETALDDYDFDYVINNNGSISDLIDKVRQILIK